jgi:hypothetical protein
VTANTGSVKNNWVFCPGYAAFPPYIVLKFRKTGEESLKISLKSMKTGSKIMKIQAETVKIYREFLKIGPERMKIQAKS